MVQAPGSPTHPQSHQTEVHDTSLGSSRDVEQSHVSTHSPPPVADLLASLKLKQKQKHRVPSFTSSPLTQRPFSPISESGSESSTSAASTAIEDTAGSRLDRLSPPSSGHHQRRMTFATLALPETIVSSEDEDDGKDALEEYDSFDVSMETASPSSYTPSCSPLDRPRRRSSLGQYSTSPLSGHSPHQYRHHSLHPSPRASTSTSPVFADRNRRRSSGTFPRSPTAGLTGPTPPGSPSLFSSSFVGSYEASLLSGRMANKPSNATALPFHAQLGVLGLGKNTPRGLKCPDHLNLDFGAYFWDMDNRERQGKGSPYVGTIDLDEHYLAELEKAYTLQDSMNIEQSPNAPELSATPPRFPGYRIPPKGQIQLVLKNANQTAVKLFLVPYDLTGMPSGTKTFLRQKSYDVATEAAGAASPTYSSDTSPIAKQRETLRYAIHLQFCAPAVKEKERGRSKKGSRRGGPGCLEAQHSPSVSPRRSRVQHEIDNLKRRNSRSSKPTTAPFIYLHKNIRVVFTSRALDLSEKLKVVMEGPAYVPTDSDASPSETPNEWSPNPSESLTAGTPRLDKERFSSYGGPGEEWDSARRRYKQLVKRREIEQKSVRVGESEWAAEQVLEKGTAGLTMEEDEPSRLQPDEAARETFAVPRFNPGFPLLNTPPSGSSFVGSYMDDPSFSRTGSRDDADVTEHPPHQHVTKASTPARSTLFSWSQSGLQDSPPDLAEPKITHELLTFPRSPTPSPAVPLPALIESGLSISRPGSRSGEKRSPTKSHHSLEGQNRGNSSPTGREFKDAIDREGCLR